MTLIATSLPISINNIFFGKCTNSVVGGWGIGAIAMAMASAVNPGGIGDGQKLVADLKEEKSC